MMQVRAFPGVRLAACLAVAASLVACGPREGASERRSGDRSGPGSAPSRPSIAKDSSAANQGDPRIVVLGDSLTAGLGLSVGGGVSGAAAAASRCRGTEISRWSTPACRAIRRPAACRGSTGRSRATCASSSSRSAATTGCAACRSSAAEATISARSSSARRRAASRSFSPAWRRRRTSGDEYTTAFHEVYPALAKQYRVALVPFLLEGVAGVERLNQRDGIHPTAEGAPHRRRQRVDGPPAGPCRGGAADGHPGIMIELREVSKTVMSGDRAAHDSSSADAGHSAMASSSRSSGRRAAASRRCSA